MTMAMQRVAPAEIVVLRGMGLLCCKGACNGSF